MSSLRLPSLIPHAVCFFGALAAGIPWAGELSGQAPLADAPSVEAPVAASSPGVSPGGAFLRSVLVPGWGHASIGAYGRGGVYFLAEGVTAFGVIKTRQRLSEARERLAFRERYLLDEAARLGLAAEELEDFLEEDATLADLDGLVGAREQQQEDWLAFGIFLLLLSGADAYVSAHLRHFPAPLELEARPAGGGRMEVSLGVGVGGRR